MHWQNVRKKKDRLDICLFGLGDDGINSNDVWVCGLTRPSSPSCFGPLDCFFLYSSIGKDKIF